MKTHDYRIAHDGMVSFLVYFRDDFGSIELWNSGGTIASTSMIKTVGYNPNIFHSFLVYHDKVYFWNYSEPDNYLWVTDGATEGTEVIFSTTTGEGTFHYFDVVNDHMLFAGTAESYPTSFYRSDGTQAGTEPFAEFKSALSPPVRRDLTTVNDLAFYADHDGPVDEGGNPTNGVDYFHLFQADGLTRKSMRTMYGISTIGTDNIVDYNGKVIFTTPNDQDESTDKQKRLWIYDPSSSEHNQVGKIQQEVWTGVTGTKTSSIPLDSPPSSVSDLTIFETPANLGDNYGSRVRGYVRVPHTGDYTFWIASDDQGQLWLSTDEDPANKVKIAEVTGWTYSRQWDKYPSQQSAPVSLVGGRKYYIEALLKERTGRDQLAVGWELPNGALERPIPGNRLIPFIPSQPSENNPPEACAGAGMIRQEFWTGVPGTHVSAIPVDTEPDFIHDLTIFEGPASSMADNYGSRHADTFVRRLQVNTSSGSQAMTIQNSG